MKKEILRDLAIEAGFIFDRFLRRPIAEIVIARQPGLARQVRLMGPDLVVVIQILVGALQPGPV